MLLTIMVGTSLLVCGAALAAPSSTPDQGTVQANGRVSDVLVVGDRVYLAGSFTQVTDTDGTIVARNNLAAMDATTGRLTGWDANGTVAALAASADGSRIYAGGSFTTIDGATRRRLVSLDRTGAADSLFKIGLDAPVRAIAVQGNRVFIGGDSISVKGQSRPRLALIDGNTGALDPNWAPATDGVVRALAISPDGTRVYAGGDFATISGWPSPNLAGLSAAGTGATVWEPLSSPNGRVYDVAALGTSIYSAEGGPGGAAAAYGAGTGARAWRRSGDGDVQAVTVLDGRVYLGGHFLTFAGQDRRFFAAVNATTGTLDAWTPSGAGAGSGAWAMATDPLGTRIYAGGDFLRVSGVTHQYFAQFSNAQ